MEIVIIFVLLVIFAVIYYTLLNKIRGKRSRQNLPLAPEPKREECPKDISEPVISFIKFLKENPENFLLKRQKWEPARYGITEKFKLIDKANRKSYTYSITTDGSLSAYLSTRSVNFLTEEENNYLLEAHRWGMEYIEKKEEVGQKLKAFAERVEYKKIYCKEVVQ